MDLWIFDIDGVVAEIGHRLPTLKKGDHRRFYMGIPNDSPIQAGISLVKLASEKSKIVFATGRPEWTSDMTEEWLFRHLAMSLPKIHYRQNGDYKPSPLVKVQEIAKILKEGGRYRNIYFVDDDPRNVKAVEEAFPRITGIIFTTWRLDEKQRGTRGQSEGVGNSGISII